MRTKGATDITDLMSITTKRWQFRNARPRWRRVYRLPSPLTYPPPPPPKPGPCQPKTNYPLESHSVGP